METISIKYGLEKIPEGYAVIKREAVKGVIVEGKKILLIKTNLGDYKFPGGGVKKNESFEDTLKREMLEETGFMVESIGELLVRTHEGKHDQYEENTIFTMSNMYISCEIKNGYQQQLNLDEYEKEQDFKAVFVDIDEAIQNNRMLMDTPDIPKNDWLKRDTEVLEAVKSLLHLPVKPKMVIFDYGNTLVKESGFDTMKGMEAVLKHSVGTNVVSVQEVADMYDRLYKDSFKKSVQTGLEVFNISMQRIVFDYHNITLDISDYEAEKIFWDAAAKGEATEGIEELLYYLEQEGIRTAVISNLSFSGNSLKKRLDELLPYNRFEFVMASSDYLYRKPNPLIFQTACAKAGISTEEMWYCGDKYDVDILGAKDAGSKAVWYSILPEETEQDVICISDWSMLKKIISDLG